MRAVAVAGAVAVTVAAFVAVTETGCSFPTLTFGDASVPDVVVPDAVSEAAADDGGTESGPVDPCDQDKDTYRSMFDGCGGNDCNDNDPAVHPNDSGAWVYTVPTGTNGNLDPAAGLPIPNGDWYCLGSVVYQYPGTLSPTGSCLTNCTAKGFQQNEGCGQIGTLGSCGGTLVCSYSTIGQVPQGCM